MSVEKYCSFMKCQGCHWGVFGREMTFMEGSWFGFISAASSCLNVRAPRGEDMQVSVVGCCWNMEGSVEGDLLPMETRRAHGDKELLSVCYTQLRKMFMNIRFHFCQRSKSSIFFRFTELADQLNRALPQDGTRSSDDAIRCCLINQILIPCWMQA